MEMVPGRTLIAILICTLLAFGCKKPAKAPAIPIETTCLVNWKSLEVAWDAYRTAPSAKLAETLVNELRTASRANENPGCVERTRVQARFMNETGQMQKTFHEPGNRGAEILDALLMHSDAGYTDELYLLLADSAVHDPSGFLEIITKKYADKGCPFITTDPEEFNDVDPRTVVRALTKNAFNRRLQAISRVKDRTYSTAREACIKELKTAISGIRSGN
jgi:hypothetical protein